MVQGTQRYLPLYENSRADKPFPGLSAKREGKQQALLLRVDVLTMLTLSAILDRALASQHGYQHPEHADCFWYLPPLSLLLSKWEGELIVLCKVQRGLSVPSRVPQGNSSIPLKVLSAERRPGLEIFGLL